MKKELISKSFINATGVFLYISAITWFMSNSKNIFGGTSDHVAGIFMLLLFVISATITATLVLGKPILLYIEGSKKEAMKMLFYTVGWLILFLIIVAVTILIK